jgi:manganese transport protein
MNSVVQLTLGVVTAIGGFVDIGELVFTVQAGVTYGFSLLWAILVGTIGIIIFSEQAGRIAAVNHKTVFTHMKERLPAPLPIFVLVASSLLNIITCAAEVGGVTIALQLLTGLSHLASLILTVGLLIVTVWVLPFKILEKLFGILGFCMIIFIIAVFARHISFAQIASGFVPTLPKYICKAFSFISILQLVS